MRPWEVFKTIRDCDSDYHCSGDSVNWMIKVDDTDKRVYLLFQETDGLYDWSVNLNFIKIRFIQPYKNQQNCFLVHRGWAKAWKSANDEIMAAFISATKEHPDYAPWVGGWSYGGAIAQLAGEDFFFNTGIKPSIITFGPPKPLYGKDTRDYFISCFDQIWMFCNVNDVVTDAPPCKDYYRVGTHYVETNVKKVWYRIVNPWRYHTRYYLEEIYDEEAAKC